MPTSAMSSSSFRLPFLLALVLILPATACAKHSDSAAAAAASASTAPNPKQLALEQQAQANILAGKQAYAKYCQICHAPDGTGYTADNAPSLVSKTFLESASDTYIASGIRLGRPNTAMAAYGKTRGGPLEELQISQIIAFLRSLGPKASPLPALEIRGDKKNGEQLYAVHCQTCHGTPTTRATAVHLFNPELLLAASPAFLRHAIVNGRPPTPMLPFKDKLSHSDVDDLLAFIVSFRPAAATPAVRDAKVPDNLPLVINPKGKHADFKLREGRYVAAADVNQALLEKRRLVIIDARSPADWIQFHIPGSVPLPYYDTKELARIPNDGTWVVAYCACPHHVSGEVVDALRKLNYPHTAVLDEGILVWKTRGYALAGEAITPAAKPDATPAAKPSATPAHKPTPRTTTKP